MNNTGGPAFPSAAFEQHEYQGMALRDYFAAKAMLGILDDPHRDMNYEYDAVASYAYSLADAMLKARDQK